MDDLKMLVNGVLDTDTYEKETESSYYSICPFCGEEIYGRDGLMQDIQHEQYCLYLKASKIKL